MASSSGSSRLLVLTALAGEDVDEYDLVGFRAREALSEPFVYHLEIRIRDLPSSLGSFIGKLAEWTLTWTNRDPRAFAGRIYEARLGASADGLPIIHLVVRPAYWAASYARGTHFAQDKSSLEMFDAVTAAVPGLVVDKQALADKRAYAVRYDETELDFLDRLLAQDGIFYYFIYDQGGGAYKHKMRLANAASGYADVPGDLTLSYAPGGESKIEALGLGLDVAASAGTRRYHGFEVNKLDTPFRSTATVGKTWSSVYEHGHDELAGGALSAAQVTSRGKSHVATVEQAAELFSGSSTETAFFAGGRVALDWGDVGAPKKIVLTVVEHEVRDDSRQGGQGSYSNSWTGIDATIAFSPPVPAGRRRAYGPMLGVVKNTDGVDGEVVVDGQSRVPVTISQAVEADADKPFDPFVWLPVAQQWASSTHGAQFFPRIGTRVMVDFLYGDPDLPFVAGTFYTPSAAYPFDPASNATQTGWRSKTNKNGAIKQEFLFEDKPDSEEVYLYTGRNYRRQVDNDELGTIKHDRTIEVQNDHKETVKNDQTIDITNDQKETVGNDQTIDVKNNRKRTVTGKEDVDVTGARTITVTAKNTLESKQEIEIKVGPSSIKLTMTGIEIKAPQITIEASATLSVKAGAQAQYQAPMIQMSADAMLVLKGGIVMIN